MKDFEVVRKANAEKRLAAFDELAAEGVSLDELEKLCDRQTL